MSGCFPRGAAVAGDSRWNARSGSPPSASGTGIVGAKQQRKKQHEQQQQQRAQQGLTSTSAAATATAGTPDLHESAGGTSSAESGFDGIPQENRRSETSGGNDAGSAFDWTPATTGLLGRPSGMYPLLHSDDQSNGLGSDGTGFHTREVFAPNAGANASVGEQTSLSSQPATGGVKGEDRGRERDALAAAAGALPVAETRSAGSPEQAVEGSTMIVSASLLDRGLRSDHFSFYFRVGFGLVFVLEGGGREVVCFVPFTSFNVS